MSGNVDRLSGMEFPRKLLRLCELRGLRQADLASEVKVSKSTVSNWFSGLRRPDMDAGLRLARLLGVGYEFLADDAQDDPPPPEVADEERAILRMVRRIGVDEAERRLLNAPGGGDDGPAIEVERVGPAPPPGPRARRGSA